MSPYASIALLALVLSVAAQNQNVQKTTINTNVNWNKQTNSAVGNVNVNGKNTPFTVSIAKAPNQGPTFTIQSQNPAGKTTTVKIIPIRPIVATMPGQAPTEPPKPIHHDVPVPIKSAAPLPPTPTPSRPVVTIKSTTVTASSFTSTTSSGTSSSSTFTSTTSEPGKPTVTVRSQTFSSPNDPKPVTVTVVSMTKPVNEPVKTEPAVHPTFKPIPSPAPVPEPYPEPLPAVTNNIDTTSGYPVQRAPEPEHKRRGCNRRLWIKGIILGLAAFGALAFLALCCRICRGRSHCCCRRRHRGCEGNPTYGIPAPVPMNQIGQPQVFVVQAQPVNDPYFQPTPTSTNRSGQPFVQLNESNSDIPANYVIGYPQPHEQPIYMIPQRQ